MSILKPPRLHFHGNCTWDPIVTNNSWQNWDLETSKPDGPPTDAATYRAHVNSQIASTGNWNPDGTHRSVFYDTYVVSTNRGAGPQTDDEIIGVPIGLSAMLVDINPYAANTSQLFYDELKVGIDGGPQIVMPNNGPIAGRYINFRRNPSLEIAGVASVIWQGSCIDDLVINEHDSEVLAAMKTEIAEGRADGVTVRINAYHTLYFDGPPPAASPPGPPDTRYIDLQRRVEGGGFQPNPARSLIVGTVGLYLDGEPRSMPGDRQLSGNLGTTFARVDTDLRRLDIDLGNTIPETDVAATKQDLGPLTVTASGTELGTLDYADYNREAYIHTAGIVSLELNETQLAAANNGVLQIAGSASRFGVTEQPLRAVVDPPNIYLEEGGTAARVALQVLDRGEPVGAETAVQIAQVAHNAGGDPSSTTPPSDFAVSTIVTDAQGRFELDTGSADRDIVGGTQWVLTPFVGNEPVPPTAANTASDCYMAVRVTPADDDLAALEPTWENVHQKVLIDWEALAPCMDNWLRLGSEDECRAIAPMIKRLTSLETFDSFLYMPVTRGLSKGQRTLLHNWIDDPAPSTEAAFDSGSADVNESTTESLVEPMPPATASDAAIDLSRGFTSR